MTFTWDPRKAEANLKKHGVDFREAGTVFEDTFSMAFPDGAIQLASDVFSSSAWSVLSRTLVVSYSEVTADTIRIITARTATRREFKFYEEDKFKP